MLSVKIKGINTMYKIWVRNNYGGKRGNRGERGGIEEEVRSPIPQNHRPGYFTCTTVVTGRNRDWGIS